MLGRFACRQNNQRRSYTVHDGMDCHAQRHWEEAVSDNGGFQPTVGMISWRIHFQSSPELVYAALATDEGRARYWAESASEDQGAIHYVFLNGIESVGRVLLAEPPRRYGVTYFGNRVFFEITPDDSGGADMSVQCMDVAPQDKAELAAGWVSWLLAMKAAVDFHVDLRNHDPSRTWMHGYADN